MIPLRKNSSSRTDAFLGSLVTWPQTCLFYSVLILGYDNKNGFSDTTPQKLISPLPQYYQTVDNMSTTTLLISLANLSCLSSNYFPFRLWSNSLLQLWKICERVPSSVRPETVFRQTVNFYFFFFTTDGDWISCLVFIIYTHENRTFYSICIISKCTLSWSFIRSL